ncbi:MAG: hypothetical protein U5N58_14825 [Actinomycetota bacterium]|nr:hypothetical protein [Actinomycetota bacterium]
MDLIPCSRDQLIGKIMGKYNSLSDMGHNLIKYAKHNGGYDNITLILIRYE